MASMHEPTGGCLLGRAAIAVALGVLLHFALTPQAWAGTDESKSGPAKHATATTQKSKVADQLDASSSVPKDSSTTCLGTTERVQPENASRGLGGNDARSGTSPDVAGSPDSEDQSNSETLKYRLRLSADRNQDSASEPALSCERPKMADRPTTTNCAPSSPGGANSPNCKPSVENFPKASAASD
jgi:hypothetical protein